MKATDLKYYKTPIIVTIFIIVASFFLNEIHQQIIAFILIFSVGIIHGANDINLIQKKSKKTNNLFFIKTLFLYILVVLFGCFSFFYIPSVGLLFFIFFSSYHFGEQHWEQKIKNIKFSRFLKFIFYTSYGSIILNLLFFIKYDEVKNIIYKISNYNIPIIIFQSIAFTSIICFLFFIFSFKKMRRFFFIELITIILMMLLFNFTTLILAFGSYFVLWHSFPSMKDQIKYLYGSFNFKNILFYLKASLLYWIASILSLIFVKIYFTIPESYLVPLFFSFMAAITFPHVLVIGRIKGSI